MRENEKKRKKRQKDAEKVAQDRHVSRNDSHVTFVTHV
jgi:hypothetical protein